MKYEFPLLDKEQISVKVKQVTANGAVALLYKSARVDMDVLDSVVGQGNWECDYREIHGNLYCGIGIYNVEQDRVIWKWDCGIESAQDDGNEKKAEASDAFKRAGFRWGIGRELYSAPFTFLNVATEQDPRDNRKWKLKNPFDRFEVSGIRYDDNRKIEALTIVNSKTGEVMFDWEFGHGNKAKKAEPARKAEPKAAHAPAEWHVGVLEKAELQAKLTKEQLNACYAKYGENLERMTEKNFNGVLEKARIEALGK